MSLAPKILGAAIRIYRLLVSPVLHSIAGPSAGCRFEPTCSQYAQEAVQAHGALHGSWLAARRVCRCHPWGGCGADPVPEVRSSAFRRPGMALSDSVHESGGAEQCTSIVHRVNAELPTVPHSGRIQLNVPSTP